MKEKIINVLIEGITYAVILLVLLLVADKSGWTTTPVLDNLLGLMIGWAIWKIVVFFINKKRK